MCSGLAVTLWSWNACRPSLPISLPACHASCDRCKEAGWPDAPVLERGACTRRVLCRGVERRGICEGRDAAASTTTSSRCSTFSAEPWPTTSWSLISRRSSFAILTSGRWSPSLSLSCPTMSRRSASSWEDWGTYQSPILVQWRAAARAPGHSTSCWYASCHHAAISPWASGSVARGPLQDVTGHRVTTFRYVLTCPAKSSGWRTLARISALSANPDKSRGALPWSSLRLGRCWGPDQGALRPLQRRGSAISVL